MSSFVARLLSKRLQISSKLRKRIIPAQLQHRRSFESNANSNTHYMGFASYGCSIPSYGQPLKVCKVTSNDVYFNRKSNDILLKTHAAPINPSDINVIEGRYAVLPKALPAICGNEGVFEVRSTGSLCSSTAPDEGDLVIASTSLLGTWQQYVTCKESDIIPLHVSIADFEKYDVHLMAQLCQIAVNPCTAYRMINDFVSLNEGEFILQNAANSAVGEGVIQIARNLGLKTMNIIRGSDAGTDTRSKSEFERIQQHLLSLGADIVLGDADIRKMSREEREKIVPRKPPKLGLNAVGGDVVADMVKLMTSDERSVVVTYGGMSRKPLTIPTAPLIFRDIDFTGFWLTKWKQKCEQDFALNEEYHDMVRQITNMITQHDLRLSYKMVRFGDVGQGMTTALKHATNAMDEIGMLDARHMVKVDDNETVEGVKGKTIVLFEQFM